MTDTPAGFKTHHGGPCPVSLVSKPAIVFRNGRIKRSGIVEADFWRGLGSEIDWWRWRGRKHTERDIIAYKPEDRP